MNALAPPFGSAGGTLSFADALNRILHLADPVLPSETCRLNDCIGRALAEPVNAYIDLPGFDQSAMDGYAVRRTDLTPDGRLPLTGRTAAGEAPGLLAAGGAHRILTGAPLPIGADAVVAQEDVHREGDSIRVATVPPIGTNIRHRGEDMRAGDELIAVGTTLDWRHIAVLAAQGICTVPVRRRPRVTLLSSGRELRGLGEALVPGQIHDSNTPMLAGLLSAWGAAVRSTPIVADDAAAMQAALVAAAEGADIILTTAGLSVGDEDHVREALRTLGGALAVFKVAMKPGKPLAAGRFGNAIFIGLPGNPMAALAGAVGFVHPLLARLTGAAAPQPLRARAGFAMQRKPGRTEFITVHLQPRDTCLWAERSGPEGSGRLAPLLRATGFAVLPADGPHVQPGDLLDVMSFTGGAAR